MGRLRFVHRCRLSDRDRALLFRQLATLLRAGLAPDRALDAIARLASGCADGRMAAQLLAGLRRGGGLAEAMAAVQEPTFRGRSVAMVRAGEAAGALDLAASRLAAVSERALDLKRGIAAAMLVPLLLLAASASAALVLVSARVSPASGAVSAPLWWLPPLAGLAVAVLVAQRAANSAFRLACDRAPLRLPGLGRLIAEAELARLLAGLAVLLGAGAPLSAALAVLAARPRNAAVAAALDRALAGSCRGRGITEVFACEPWFPPGVAGELAAGELSGCLGEMAARVAQRLDGPASRFFAHLAGLSEPARALGAALLTAGLLAALLHQF